MIVAMRCPCGSDDYATCCQPLLEQRALAPTAVALMRSRYTAFALGDDDHLFRTWHPRTRPDDVRSGHLEWTGLQILDVVDGGPDDQSGVVDFAAHYRDGRSREVLRERSRFERRAGRWFYVDGDLGAG